jgi:hypothetical protein
MGRFVVIVLAILAFSFGVAHLMVGWVGVPVCQTRWDASVTGVQERDGARITCFDGDAVSIEREAD